MSSLAPFRSTLKLVDTNRLLLVNERAVTEAAISLSEVNQCQVTQAMILGNLRFARPGGGSPVLSGDEVTVEAKPWQPVLARKGSWSKSPRPLTPKPKSRCRSRVESDLSEGR